MTNYQFRLSALVVAAAALRSLRPFAAISSIQRHAAADVSRHVQVFAVADGRLAFLEAAFENDFQRQFLLQARELLARTAGLARA